MTSGLVIIKLNRERTKVDAAGDGFLSRVVQRKNVRLRATSEAVRNIPQER